MVMCRFGDLDENGGLYKRPGDGDPKTSDLEKAGALADVDHIGGTSLLHLVYPVEVLDIDPIVSNPWYSSPLFYFFTSRAIALSRVGCEVAAFSGGAGLTKFGLIKTFLSRTLIEEASNIS
jgi:hypothetical protein